MDGDCAGSSGSQRSFLEGVWKVSPFRMDIFWNESMSEGVTSRAIGRAGRRRGWADADDMLGGGDLPTGRRIEGSVVCEVLAWGEMGACSCDSPILPHV